MSKGVQGALDAVLVKSENIAQDTPTVRGVDFNEEVDLQKLLDTYLFTGYQANHLGRAFDIINEMIRWRLSDEPMTEEEKQEEAELPESERLDRKNIKATIFLGYTSNLISSGLREIIRFLCQHNLVSCIVTTAGGIEEDFIKCMRPTYLGDFSANGADLRSRGLNRIGNLVVPNENYCSFEDWLMPILDQLLLEQNRDNIVWSPSKIIQRLGKEINNEDSVYYWCYKNNIPVFCPAITDGSLGDMMFFHSFNKPGLIVDILQDLRTVNNLAINAYKSGCVVLGSGIVKHHICNANLMRNGSDWTVYVNTAQEYDGSDAGATPDEAVSWGKIKSNAKSVKVHADATIVFPLIAAKTFAHYYHTELKPKQQ